MNPTITDYANYLSDAIGSTGNSRFKISAKFEVEAKASTDVEKLFRSYINEYTNQHVDYASEHVCKLTPTVEDYRHYIVNEAVKWMEPQDREKCGNAYAANANKTQKPTECFEQFIETYGNESPLDASEKVRNRITQDITDITVNRDVVRLKDAISDTIKKNKLPPREPNPLIRIRNYRASVAAGIRKCSAQIGNVDVSEYCRNAALKGFNVEPDKVAKNYPNSSDASFGGSAQFQGRALKLELIVKR